MTARVGENKSKCAGEPYLDYGRTLVKTYESNQRGAHQILTMPESSPDMHFPAEVSHKCVTSSVPAWRDRNGRSKPTKHPTEE
jgi:hypothetical protein